MALSLDPTLAAAQVLQSRHPLAEIISSPQVPDIPFDGTRLTGEAFDEYGPSVIAHSTGRLILAYIADTDTRSQIKFVYTDTDRTAFSTVTLDLYSLVSSQIEAVSICEMTGGNIGMVLLVHHKSGHVYRLARRVYTPVGVAVGNSEIANWDEDLYTGDPWVITKGANDYYAIFTRYVEGDAHYHFFKTASSDFAAWATPSEVAVGGLDASLKLGNPSMLKVASGDIWLWFDVVESVGPNGEELSNVYYSISTDNGVSWANATKFTNYTKYSETGKHPVMLQKIATQLYMMFTKQVSVLQMDDTAAGWPMGDIATDLQFDSVNRKLYVLNTMWGGWNGIQCVVKIDVDTWTVEKYWDDESAPAAFDPDCMYGCMHTVPQSQKGDGDIVPITIIMNGFVVLEGEADTIKNYWVNTSTWTKNVRIEDSGFPGGPWEIIGCQADYANRRLYIAVCDISESKGVVVGYIDLDDAGSGDPVTYGFTQLLKATDWTQTQMTGLRSHEALGEGGFLVDLEENVIILSAATVSSLNKGRLAVYDITSGGRLCEFNPDDNPDFPYQGIRRQFHYTGGKIYGSFNYHASQPDLRGLCVVDVASGIITYQRPSYATLDDYELRSLCAGPDGKLVVSAYGYGIALYDPVSYSWELFSSDNIPAMTPDSREKFLPVAYDSAGEFIFAGAIYGSSDWTGVIMFSAYGFIQQANYSVGTWSGAAWSWSTPDELVQGYIDHEAVGVADPGDNTSMFVFWTNEGWDLEKRIKWDKDGTDLDLAPYITGEISTEHSIEGMPAKLSFTATHGYLFDPYNLSSVFNMYLKKGRKLTLRWGEKVDGTDYWQNAGTFYVTGSSLSFARGDYPVMKIEAEDRRCIWEHHHVYATKFYEALPKVIVEEVLKDHADLEETDLSIPDFVGGTVLEHQWIDTTIDEIVNQVCNRFGYYFRFDVNGDASARRISNAATVDHVYADSTKLFRYSPDDKYSDFTNRVTVQGQELDFREVLFSEEAVGRLNGTVGWWGFHKDFKIWYSDDHSRQCRYPRLEVIETATSIAFKLAGSISESIAAGTLSGYEDRYCTVTVSAPNLIPVLIAGIAIWAAGCAIPDAVVVGGFGASVGHTIPIGRLVEKIGMIMCIMVLGATGNFQYVIHGQPVGSVRRSVQATWDDEDHQAEIGAIIEQAIQDPLCYSVTDCEKVAAFEGMVVQLQRKRLSMSKVAHLQDEEGDTITMVHPYSGQTMTFFVTNLTRKFKKSAQGSSDGYFIDEIEGWVVS